MRVPVVTGCRMSEDTLNGAEPKLGCMSLVEIAGGGANRELVRMGAIFFDKHVA